MTEPDFLSTTRAYYDAVAADYAERFRAELAAKPMERGLLTAFAELVRAADAGPVADLGCGPGNVTAYLHGLGVSVSGIDLSAEMVSVARKAHPELRFDVGSMTALNLPDGALGGIVAMYSIIHVPEERLPVVFAEFHRVLAPGGEVLLVFQVGNEQAHVSEAFGRAVSLDCFWRQPDQVADLLGQAGLPVHARFLREPDQMEKVPRGCLMARKAA